MRTIINIINIVIISMLIVSCGNNDHNNKAPSEKDEISYKDVLKKIKPDIHEVIALESITKGSYTYVKLKENDKEYWAAISARPIETGKSYYYKDAFEMANFESKSLNKVFESIWFINDFYSENPQKDLSNSQNSAQNKVEKHTEQKEEEIQSLAQVFKNKSQLENKWILVKGKVEKINPHIMNKNWIHIQDGTSYNNYSDLTITTTEDIDFELGDTIVFQGKLTLNKDFGAGYLYDFILEDAIRH